MVCKLNFHTLHIILVLLVGLCQFGISQPIRTLKINPDFARGGNVSQLFDSVSYIPLETTKESVFGNIQNLQVSKHYFVFYDYSTKGIFIFDKKGKFVGKISDLPGLHIADRFLLNDFVLNPYNEKIYQPYYLPDANRKNKFHQFMAIVQPSGQLDRIITLDTILFKTINPSSFSFLDSNTAIFAKVTRDSSTKDFFAIVKNFKTSVRNYYPIKESDPFVGFAKDYRNTTKAQDYAVWSRFNDYDIVLTQDQGLTSYRFLFPKAISLDASFYADTLLMKDASRSFAYNKLHKDKINGIYNIFLSSNNLTFALMKGNSFSANDCYLMNLNSGNLYNMGRITPDSMNAYLPIISASMVAADEDYIYSKIAAHVLFQAKKENEPKHPQYSPILQSFFSTQSRKSNSVIIVLQPKKNL